jgi:hypothetical protein
MAIDTPYILNDDALASQFEGIIPPFPGIVADPQEISKRITKVTVNEKSLETYTVDYKSQKVTKFKGKIGTSNQLTISFRNDKENKLYQSFRGWMDFIADPKTGTLSPDFVAGVSLIRIPITIFPVFNEIPTSVGWVFTFCAPSKIGSITYQHAGGEVIEFDVTFEFVQMI